MFFYNEFINRIQDMYKFYDILCLGGNLLYPKSYMDTYQKYSKDYIEHLEWLHKFSVEYPKLKLGFKKKMVY